MTLDAVIMTLSDGGEGAMMERYSDKAAEIINALHTERLEYNSEYLPLIEAANRLAAYEDTGLEPEEIVKMGMALEDSKRYSGRLEGKLKAYETAKQEGRLVVLPCDPEQVMYCEKPGAAGKVVTPNGEVRSCVFAGDPAKATGLGYISHFSTCPEADRFRKRK